VIFLKIIEGKYEIVFPVSMLATTGVLITLGESPTFNEFNLT